MNDEGERGYRERITRFVGYLQVDFVFGCVCLFVRVWVCESVDAGVRVFAYASMFMLYICVYLWVGACVYTYAFMCACICVFLFKCMFICEWKFVYANACVC